MRRLLLTVVTGGFLALAGSALAQSPPDSPSREDTPPRFRRLVPSQVGALPPAAFPASPPASLQAQLAAQQRDIAVLSQTVRVLTEQFRGAPAASIQQAAAEPALPAAAEAAPLAQAEDELRQTERLLAEMTNEQAAAQQAPPAAQLQKQLELQQKQIELFNKMVKLLAKRLEQQAPAGNLEVKVATLEARSRQAAQREQELAAGLDNVNEHVDAVHRTGVWLPAPLKELFDSSYNNETPLSIYGAVSDRYTQFHPERWGVVETPTFSAFFLLTLNQRIFVEANVDLSTHGADVPWAQVDFLLNDCMTAVVGRYLLPIGFYNERLAYEWGNKMPDDPLMFNQVSPLASTNGVQLRGSSYICGSPVKLEYSVYGGNGMELSAPPATSGDLANLSVLAGSDETHAKAVGGRLGLWVPKWGVNGGVSGYYDYNYGQSAPTLNLGIVSVDASYHRGNWDARFESAYMNQQAAAITGQDIQRYGLYAQLAYRPYDVSNRFLQKLEVVGRYGMERFTGIDATMLDFSTFDNLTFVPVDRNQYAFSLNYYFYASGIIKFAYEINQELHGRNLNDNVFYSQFVFAF